MNNYYMRVFSIAFFVNIGAGYVIIIFCFCIKRKIIKYGLSNK
uniref:Hypothetical secreted peptide n=1 Tax=Triatoma matogrossensis TaxID=162370 RepID=E2J7C4_9HEMI